jgi:hypothetical protein
VKANTEFLLQLLMYTRNLTGRLAVVKLCLRLGYFFTVTHAQGRTTKGVGHLGATGPLLHKEYPDVVGTCGRRDNVTFTRTLVKWEVGGMNGASQVHFC